MQVSERSRIRCVECFAGRGGAGSDGFGFGFATIELARDIGANAPERLLVGLSFLAFASCALVRGANEAVVGLLLGLWPTISPNLFGHSAHPGPYPSSPLLGFTIGTMAR